MDRIGREYYKLSIPRFDISKIICVLIYILKLKLLIICAWLQFFKL